MYYRSKYLKDFSYGQYDSKDPVKPRIGTEIKFKEYVNLLKPNMKDHIKNLESNILLESILFDTEYSDEDIKKVNLLNKITQELNGRVISSNNSTYEQSLINYLNSNDIILSYIPFNIIIELFEHPDEYTFDGIATNIRIRDGFLLIDKVEIKEDYCISLEEVEIKNSIYHDYEISAILSWPCYKINKIEIKDIFTNEFYNWSSI